MKTPEVNIQNEVQKIHAQFGTSELANYKIQLLFDAQIKTMQEDHENELIEYKVAVELAMQRIRLFYRWLQYNHYVFVKEDIWVGEDTKGKTETELFQTWDIANPIQKRIRA